jgi:hypothetical protein
MAEQRPREREKNFLFGKKGGKEKKEVECYKTREISYKEKKGGADGRKSKVTGISKGTPA